jgi:hypothetical protein
LFLLLAAISARADEFCSLAVHVTNQGGYKPAGVPVRLVESNGRTESGVTKNGEVRFCDLGTNPVTLTVGERDGCSEVVLRNVAVGWNIERILKVIYDRTYCNGDEIQSIGCLDLLRFVDEQGKPVAQVHFEPPLGAARTVHSDAYGRVMVQLQPGEKSTFKASSPGYAPETVELNCGATTSKRERMITLHSAK